ncbi:hypothetical protein [Microvirga pakistanensis]|uniref:hypothetical protein n=1 Tax=Microvirga pakistanensis TaxID=1682650 RepID=UPI00106D35FD|nr:hypothetical protein [Microvirga pakistanensis]
MRKLTEETWNEIAQQYADGIAVRAIARTFNVSWAAIMRRAQASGWARGRAGDRRSHASQSAQDRFSGSPQTAGVDEVETVDPRTALLQRHRAAWAQIDILWDDAFHILRGEKPTLLEDMAFDSLEDREATAAKLMNIAKMATKGLMVAQEGERRAYGFDYKQQQEAAVEDEATARRRKELEDSLMRMGDKLRSIVAAFQAAETPLPEEAQQSKGCPESGTGGGG